MTDQTGRGDPELPAASLEERVHRLEERLIAVADAVRVLAHGLEDVPVAEPGRRPTTEAARRAYELLLIAEPRELRPGAASPHGQPVWKHASQRRDVAVPAGEGAAFEVVQAEAGFQFAVVVLDPPADLGQPDELGDRGVFGQVGQPVVGGLVGFGGPFGQQPALRQAAVGGAGDVAGWRGGPGSPGTGWSSRRRGCPGWSWCRAARSPAGSGPRGDRELAHVDRGGAVAGDAGAAEPAVGHRLGNGVAQAGAGGSGDRQDVPPAPAGQSRAGRRRCRRSLWGSRTRLPVLTWASMRLAHIR